MDIIRSGFSPPPAACTRNGCGVCRTLVIHCPSPTTSKGNQSLRGFCIIKLGEVIKKYRQNQNLPLDILASELGVSTDYLIKLERGLTDEVTLDFLNRVLMYIPIQHVLESIKSRPELAMWLAVQNALSARFPPESLTLIYGQVMAILNKLGELWLKCPSVEEMVMLNDLFLRNLESLDGFLNGRQEELSSSTE
ncbi:MAG: helix-turn-helix domain-containing protein [Bacillota bacterium]